MNIITKAFKHFKTVCTHKRCVFLACCKADIPWQGIKHDMSKFSPVEFFESIKYYSGTDSPINACKKENGISYAWLHHKGRNKHHYEYWQDNFDQGGQPLQMPYKYAIEQVCDYIGAGRAYMGDNFSYKAEYEWWKNRIKNPIKMHPQTLSFTESMLKTMAEENSSNVLCYTRSHEIYVLEETMYHLIQTHSKDIVEKIKNG